MVQKKKKKKLFDKLYTYYCRKLLKKLPLTIIQCVIVIFLVSMQIWLRVKLKRPFIFGSSDGKSISNLTGFLKETLSLSLSLFLLNWMLGSIFTTGLVGGYMGGQMKFGLNKESSRGEDIKTLVFTPRITRKDVVWTKFVAVFTYCFGLGLALTTLPFAIYFAVASEISLLYLLFFLVFHGLILNLASFSLLIPAFFYVNSIGSLFLLYAFLFVFVFIGNLSWFFFQDFIFQNLFLASILFVFVSALAGLLFFRLWKKDFLQKDLV